MYYRCVSHWHTCEQQAEMSREASCNVHEVQQLLLANGELKARDEL